MSKQEISTEFKNDINKTKSKNAEEDSILNSLINHLEEGFVQCKVIHNQVGAPYDFDVLKVNKAFCIQMSIDKDAIVGRTLLQFFPDLPQVWFDHFILVAKNRITKSFTEHNIKTGKYYDVTVYSPKKDIIHITFKDRTALENKTNKLKALKKEYKNTIHNMLDGFMHVKLIRNKSNTLIDYKILHVNRAYEKQTGLSINTVKGKTIKEIFPDVENKWLKIIDRVDRTGKQQYFMDYNRNTNKYFEINAYSPKPNHVIKIIKDVTKKESERKELEAAYQKLEESELLKSKFISHMIDGFMFSEVILNEDGEGIDYKILDVNPGFEKQTGIKSEEIIGKTLLEFNPKTDKKWLKKMCAVAITQQPFSGTDINTYTNRIFEVNAYSPKPNFVVAVFRDVTHKENERKKLEKAYKKAEENEKLKSAFLANMSHEIRTPMNGILGCSALLENDNITAEERKECIHNIKSSGKNLLRIISDILDISKIDSLQQNLIYSDYDLNAIMDQIWKQFKITHEKKQIHFKLKKGLPKHMVSIKTDATRLTQVLSNLLENAFKFTTKGTITFGYLLQNDDILFFVKDTGIGIKKENQELIFERFGQIQNPKTKLNTGSGLGISIAKGIVLLFDGVIWVESTLGQGSEFYFKIPYLPAKKIEMHE